MQARLSNKSVLYDIARDIDMAKTLLFQEFGNDLTIDKLYALEPGVSIIDIVSL